MANSTALRGEARRFARGAFHKLPGPVKKGLRRALNRPGSPLLNIPSADLATISDPDSDRAHCPLCGTTADSFLGFGVKAERPDCRCPSCGSLERHRLVWLFFALHTDLFAGLEPDGSPSRPGLPRRRMLHVAPEPTMGGRLRQMPTLRYLSADIEPGRAMVEMDITAIDRPDASFDIIYASHVLEHVPDDVRAMSELRRVLHPDGWAVLEVPIHGPTTVEDLTVTDPEERNRRFGQHDHVRMYGHDGEYERRLRAAGFDVSVVSLATELGPAAVRRFRLRPHEDVFLCRPARQPS